MVKVQGMGVKVFTGRSFLTPSEGKVRPKGRGIIKHTLMIVKTDDIGLRGGMPAERLNQMLLIVEDDKSVRDLLMEALAAPERIIVGAATAAEAVEITKAKSPAVILLDIGLPDSSGLMVLSEALKDDPKRMVIMLTGRADEEAVIESMRRGAMDYLTKPFKMDALIPMVDKAFGMARRSALTVDIPASAAPVKLEGVIVGRSPKMVELFKLIGKVAGSDVPVLITGDSGTGKELVAKALHNYGSMKSGPFVAVDCGSLPPTLLEGELFGYERGAFTGAVAAKPGRFEMADGGTLFLDEIGNIAIELQSKLLRVIQEHATQRLGSNKSVHWEARIVSATNSNVKEMTANGKFREDLLFRLAGVEIRIPPLRERLDDLPLLVAHFAERWFVGSGTRISISKEAMTLLSMYHWPGNIRELENVFYRAATLSRGQVIHAEDLPPEFRGEGELVDMGVLTIGGREGVVTMDEMKRKYARYAVEVCNGNKTEAARTLGIDRKTLNSMLEEPQKKISPV